MFFVSTRQQLLEWYLTQFNEQRNQLHQLCDEFINVMGLILFVFKTDSSVFAFCFYFAFVYLILYISENIFIYLFL